MAFDGFGTGIAIHSLRCSVPTGDPTVHVLADNSVLEELLNGSELLKGFFRSLAVGNV
jgi:hypothetical protein